ncbi:MAG TPA: hypothetical protein VJ579_02350 [Candidatus Paceibacterota bacterium]|nr:hypothetical protein [Candidatus Paceibacterota bacterium]
MNAILTFLRGLATSAGNAVSNILKTMFLASIFMLGLTFVMWLLNIFGLKELNYVFFFLGGIMIFFIGFNPATIVTSILVGAVAGGINREGIMKGALTGPARLLYFIIGLLYAFFALAGLLATTSFAESPSSFFAIMAMTMLLGVATAFVGAKASKFAFAVVAVYAAYICVRAIWAIIPVETKYNLGIPISAIQDIDNVIGTGSKEVKRTIDAIVTIEERKANIIREEKRRQYEAAEAAAAVQREEDERRDKIRRAKEEEQRAHDELKRKLDKTINDLEGDK